MATASELLTRKWYYQIKGDSLFLYMMNSSSESVVTTNEEDALIPPDIAITEGLKIEFITGDNVFVDTNGDDDNTSPSESSVINCSDNVARAVIYYVKARMREDIQEDVKGAEYYFMRWKAEAQRAMEAKVPGPRVALPQHPYAIR